MGSQAARIIGFALWGFLGILPLYAKDQPSNVGIRLPISDATDRVFIPISAGKETSRAWVGQIVDDNQGFLWFGTRDGLDRYDGYQVRPYGLHPSGGDDGAIFFQDCCLGVSLLPGMARYALFRDHSGKIWIGADESLYQYDSKTERFSRLPFAPGELQGLVRNVNQDRTGMIWLATSRGLIRYNPANGETAHFLHNDGDSATLSSHQVRATLETKDGTFWVATNVSVDILDRQTGRVTEHLPLRNPLQNPTSIGNPYVRLLEDRSGTVWIASARDGLAFVDRPRSNLTFLALASGSDPEPGAWAILEDRYGALWVGTERGLLKLERDRQRFVCYRNDPTDPSSLPADWVLALFEDHEDGIWVGTANAGVARIPEHPLPFRRYKRRQGTSGSSGPDYVFTAYEDSRGVIWAGTKGAINRIDLKTGSYTVQPIGENTEVASITADQSGRFWIGTVDGSLFRFNPATQQSVVYRHDAANSTGCSNNEVRALLVDHLGTLWAGAGDSLCAFDEATNRFRPYKMGVQSRPIEIDAIAEDAAGILWVGSRHAGLYRFDPAAGKFTIFRHSVAAGSLSSDVVTSILVDRTGTIWVGTLNGLNQLDSATGNFTVYTESDGLPSSMINGVVEDASGDLWITTTYGLSHFKPRSKTFYNYYRSDGVLDDLTGAWKGRSGQMLFGSYSGLTALAPDAVDEKLLIPRVVLTNFQISDKPVLVGADSPLKESISVTKALTLSHGQNTLSFEFAALSYSDPERTRYRYRLEGLESGWNEVASTQHFARYSTLAPSKYVFHVEARTSRGSWTEKGAEVRIVILPPLWATWPFRAGYALAVGLMMWLGWRLRVRQLARQLNLRFEERLGERTRIARELHDTLLQSFHGLLFRFQAARNMLPRRPEEAIQALDGALKRTEQAIVEGRGAIQHLRSEPSVHSDLEHLLTAIGQELEGSGDANLGSASFRVTVEGQRQALSPILQDEVYRIARELVRNAFQHARARQIEAEIRYDDRVLRLRIRDDGKGIDPKVLQEGGRPGHWGLPGVRERAKQIGARLDCWSEAGAGTEIELTVPASVAYANLRDDRGLRLFRKKTRTYVH
jgi:ligand-binding sensor domain-containing protein/signal transduction histidine kinase